MILKNVENVIKLCSTSKLLITCFFYLISHIKISRLFTILCTLNVLRFCHKWVQCNFQSSEQGKQRFSKCLVLKQLVSKQEQVLQSPLGRILFPPLYFNFHELHKLDENSILIKFIKVKSHFEMGVIVTEFTVAFRLRTYGKC